jgi:hypothetical protein
MYSLTSNKTKFNLCPSKTQAVAAGLQQWHLIAESVFKNDSQFVYSFV